MDAKTLIARVRDGAGLRPEEAHWIAGAIATGEMQDAQVGAFAMAVLLKGLSEEARVALTLGMRDSGDVLRWSLDAPVVDKHSTGGVGDCASLPLAPALAACGVFVPMISGRGLGHTGGTLDKLEAIPGYRVDLTEDGFREVVGKVGCAIVSASADLAPADRRLYAIRDVTATVESIDLITASILSKKLAAGLGALVLDVKQGSGAFMKRPEDARALARSLVATANGAGCTTSALVTDMSQPLVPTAGNALEVATVMEMLTGTRRHERLHALTVALGGELLATCGAAGTAAEGEAAIEAALTDGRALERFARMVAAQGGPANFAETWQRDLPAAPVVRDVPSPADGTVAEIDTHALGSAVVALGGGRLVAGQEIDPAVGLSDLALLGETRGAGEPLARVHAADDAAADRAVQAVRTAYRLGARADLPPLVAERIGP